LIPFYDGIFKPEKTRREQISAFLQLNQLTADIENGISLADLNLIFIFQAIVELNLI